MALYRRFVPRGYVHALESVGDEPLESPFLNTLVRQQSDPLTVVPADPMNPIVPPGDPAYPLIATTCRLTEHYLSGPMSRFDSWLGELQPEMFAVANLHPQGTLWRRRRLTWWGDTDPPVSVVCCGQPFLHA
jgi:hypothetical protein